MRNVLLALLVVCGGALGVMAAKSAPTPVQASAAAALQIAGQIPAQLDRAAERVIPIEDLDEAELGRELARRREGNGSADADDQLLEKYLGNVLVNLQKEGKWKAFSYRAFLERDETPNAYALPGGVIVVTRGLISHLRSEAELAAVMAHELGHVELSHCLSTVKFELAAQKIGLKGLGTAADFTQNLLLRHSYSKTQEDEADQFAFDLLRNSSYDPTAVGLAFRRLREATAAGGEAQNPNFLRDYFQTHPATALREAKFMEQARSWWSGEVNRPQKTWRFRGRKNLVERSTSQEAPATDEWVDHYVAE